MEPSADVIKGLKDKFPGRSLEQVEAVDGEESYSFVITGPNREEYKKYTDDLMKAREVKDEKDKIEATRWAIEKTALAMIRWPDRETVVELFSSKPAMSLNFAEVLHKAAGSNFEVRSKKL